MQFGQILATARLQYGISQSQLANVAGYDHSYISRVESNTRQPSREAVERFADAFEYATPSAERDALLVAAGYVPYESQHDWITDPILLKLNTALHRATDDDRLSVRLTLSVLTDGLEYDYQMRRARA